MGSNNYIIQTTGIRNDYSFHTCIFINGIANRKTCLQDVNKFSERNPCSIFVKDKETSQCPLTIADQDLEYEITKK